MALSELADLLKNSKNLDLQKMSHQLSKEAFKETLALWVGVLAEQIPLRDFKGAFLSFLPSRFHACASFKAQLQMEQGLPYAVGAMTDELVSSMKIEAIETSPEAVKKILKGFAATGAAEERVSRLKQGLDFISNRDNLISEANLHRLYHLAIDPVAGSEGLPAASVSFRDKDVYLVSSLSADPVHTGIQPGLIQTRVADLIALVNSDHAYDHFLLSIIVHFYLAYLHPWFDGNGRMARLVQLWYLIQSGYPSALYISFSKYILESRAKYYRAFRIAELNEKYLGCIDLSPFLIFFSEEVIKKVRVQVSSELAEVYQQALARGEITLKEQALWDFVVSHYGDGEFSTKMLEKDFGAAAYATIYNFVQKFTELKLLRAQQYANRRRYRLN